MGATSCSICAGENFAVCAAAGVPSGASSAAQAGRAISAASATRINGSARRLPDAPSLWGGLSSTTPRRDPASDGMGDLYPSNRSASCPFVPVRFDAPPSDRGGSWGGSWTGDRTDGGRQDRTGGDEHG